ncbi:hypothetical protein TNCV_759861 [Trichonephila clavipes]|nr:hypothetical protein TNCV_759861 [Trichonephila clavipes]
MIHEVAPHSPNFHTIETILRRYRVNVQQPLYIVVPHCSLAEIVKLEIEVVSPSIVPSGSFTELKSHFTCMVLKANDRRTSCPCQDEFRGPRSDYVRQVALATTTTNSLLK